MPDQNQPRERKLGLEKRVPPAIEKMQHMQGTKGSFQSVANRGQQPGQQQEEQSMPTAPAAQPQGVIQGTMPLPAEPVQIDPGHFTVNELATLKKLGYREGDPIPANFADLLEQVKQEAIEEATNYDNMPLPGDPKSPPLNPNKTVDIDDLPEEKKQQLSGYLEQAARQAKQQQHFATPMQPGGPGVAEAAAGRAHQTIRVVDDREGPQSATTGEAEQDRPPRQDQPQERREAATTDNRLARCPHCEWPLDVAEGFTLTEFDRETFMMSFCGGLPWMKTFELAGGKVKLTVRTLRTYEIDAVYRQTAVEDRRGDFVDVGDKMEQLNRYHHSLQLVSYTTPDDHIGFPESLQDWGGEINREAGDVTALPAIKEQVYGEVIVTESIARLITFTVNQFNRMVAKLEAENTDFTGAARPRDS